MRNKIILWVLAFLAVFLIGFGPMYVRATRAEDQFETVSQEAQRLRVRDALALTYLQAAQKNFGLAAESSSRFFTQARELSDRATDSEMKKSLEAILGARDKITAGLAKGETGVLEDLQNLYLKTREATAR
jgi:hypothetical protein